MKQAVIPTENHSKAFPGTFEAMILFNLPKRYKTLGQMRDETLLQIERAAHKLLKNPDFYLLFN